MSSNLQAKVDHVVVLMLENRSFDDLVGWLYDSDNPPSHFLPSGSPQQYNGLSGTGYSNPTDLSSPTNTIPATEGVRNFFVPTPDPNELFKHMNRQLFGLNIDPNTGLPPEGAIPGMQGFLADYMTAKHNNPTNALQLMQTYSPDELTVLSGIARSYAISDNYHASSPTQTWPNRAFMHAGTSLGHVNNFPYIPYDATTIFNAFEDAGASWAVYKSSEIIPSLTRIQMIKLWDPFLFRHFHHIDRFIEGCKTGDLPAYSFLEPRFVVEAGDKKATSEHPPADVCAGEQFLETIWNAVVNSPVFERMLFIINFDEHGGCPDHVPPNWTAKPPDSHSMPGDEGFGFNRYGVRVPAIFVSPYIPAGTVFRASSYPWTHSSVPYDHTSIIAMLLDWKGIDRSKVPSKRVAAAPPNPFDELLSLPTPRTDRPTFEAACSTAPREAPAEAAEPELTWLQQSIVAADAHFRAAKAAGFKPGVLAEQSDIEALLSTVRTPQDKVAHFRALYGSTPSPDDAEKGKGCLGTVLLVAGGFLVSSLLAVALLFF